MIIFYGSGEALCKPGDATASQNVNERSKLTGEKGMFYTLIMNTFELKQTDWPIELNYILKDLEVIE